MKILIASLTMRCIDLVDIRKILIHPVCQVLKDVVVGNLLHRDIVFVDRDCSHGVH